MVLKKLLIGGLIASAMSAASAQVTLTNDRSAFTASGTIAYNSNFDDYAAGNAYPGWSYLPSMFTRGDVTYTSAQAIALGPTSGYTIGLTQTVLSDNFYTPITADINTAPKYTLLGFDAAVTSDPLSITVYTNKSSYTFGNLIVSNGAHGFTFEGFEITGAGEYFVGFQVDSIGGGYLPGITNVAVGVTAVPEPQTYAMMLAGVALLGVAVRRRKA